MQFKEIDATTIQYGLIAHGVNRRLAMGSGIAGALARKWPIVREQYLTRKDPVPKLGSIDLVVIRKENDTWEDKSFHSPLIVANCYSQDNFGGDGQRYADPDAIYDIARKLLVLANCYDLPVYIPRIGCELGGLDWHGEVKPALLSAERELKDLIVGQPEELLYTTEFIVIDVPGGKWGNS